MADQNGAYNAGVATRNLFTSPGVRQSTTIAKRRALDSVVPGASLIGPTVDSIGSFVSGLLGNQPRVAAPAAAKPKPAAANKQNPIPPALRAATSEKAGNPTFADMASMLAAANGGQVSLRQLGALSDVAYKTSPRQSTRTPTFKDIVGAEALGVAKQMLAAEHAKADELSKTDPVAGQKYGQAATAKYLSTISPWLGADPLEAQIAAQIAAGQPEE